MINFWFCFIFLMVNWFFGLYIEGISNQTILMSVLFFALYFIIPLLKDRWRQYIYLILPIFIVFMFHSPGFNGFSWLIYIALALQSVHLFQKNQLLFYVIYLYILSISSHVFYQEWLLLIFMTLLAVITGMIYLSFRKVSFEEQEIQIEYENLNDEFQTLKQQLINSEQVVRQEERNQIAREIHDSVGHRLTALLMQLEVERIKATNETAKERFAELKKLAQTSLYDTREAVKALQSEETVGIQAIIQLIRKLEAESQLRLTMTMQAGVLGIYLSNVQSITIYRSIQEALTNMMRHSSSRQAEIEFRIIANRELRFRVGHPLKEKIHIQEGFGLTNIRERLAEINGRMSIEQTENTLHVIGQFPLEEKNDD